MKHQSRAEVRVTIAIDPDDPDRFSEVVESLRRAGLSVESEQPELGIVTGTAAEAALASLAAVDGVKAVERERPFQLPDPDSPVQ